MLPRKPAHETDDVFERKKALNRNVATRQPARDVGKLLTFVTFAKLLEKNLQQTTKLITKTGLNKAWAEEQNKKGLPNSTTFREKKANCEKFAGDDWLKIIYALRKPRTLP